MRDFIKKGKLRDYLRDLKLEECKVFDRIQLLENTIGMSLDEYFELQKLYDFYYEISIKIKILKKLLSI